MAASFFRSSLICGATLFLLSSCSGWVQSNIGTCIRESALVHTGVDVRHPVDGKVYQSPGQRQAGEAYVRAPEITYRLSHPLFIRYDIKGLAWDLPEPRALHPTGRERLALATCSEQCPWNLVKSVDHIPGNVRSYPARKHERDSPHLKDDLTTPPTPSWWRRAAAAPFDVALDPLLTVTVTVGEYACGLISLPFWMLYHLVSDSPSRNESCSGPH